MSILILITLLYLLCSILYVGYLWTKKENLLQAGFYLGIVAFISQSFYLINLFLSGSAIAGGLSKSLFLFSWFITIIFIFSRIKFRTPTLGAFIFPLAFIFTLPSLIIPQGIISVDPSLSNPWILVHVILILLGEAFFAIAFITGILYIFEEKGIKEKKIGTFLMKLPSLTSLDRIASFCLLMGFPLITLGLAIGLFSANQIWGPNWKWDYKLTWSLVTWIVYAILINGRLSFGWKGRKSAIGAIIGFIIVLFTFIIGYFTPTQHNF